MIVGTNIRSVMSIFRCYQLRIIIIVEYSICNSIFAEIMEGSWYILASLFNTRLPYPILIPYKMTKKQNPPFSHFKP